MQCIDNALGQLQILMHDVDANVLHYDIDPMSPVIAVYISSNISSVQSEVFVRGTN